MTESWSGSGLPPTAAARVARERAGGTWSSALSTGEFAAIRSVGFEPVGQVMGSAVYHVGRSGQYWGYHACGYVGRGWARSVYGPAGVILSGNGGPSEALVRVMDSARGAALGRMTAECTALGGDGVVAAQLTMAPFPAAPDCLEFKVIGTAVRATGPVRPRRPFTSHLDGQGFAKLITAGWVPVELLVGMSIGVRHDDFRTGQQRYSWNNQEMEGWTALVHLVRADARTQLHRQGAGQGGDGVILADGDLRVWEERCMGSSQNSEQTDHIAESTLIGTAIARFAAKPSAPRTLTVLPLNSGGDRLRRRLAQAARPGARG
ncbi:heavy metal-binding domain-containing protein [Kitasatospora sp. NBC_01250]|uniref:heavy metal-binding domain-containing protein n=1 Tax=unclassified Kitasatospora TaxID=2633591 RepID=UPI002E0FCE55|nr:MULTISPECIES: heavy metal-binding domain-containing protein [unclassified Kitasatospora]WSJ70864.1 heavy metal-binding domain-containing protein [Kitasatospora sp. NBC_01302]